MKNLLRILVVATFLSIIFYYTSTEPEKAPLQGPSPKTNAIPVTEFNSEAWGVIERPETGLSVYVDQSTETIIKDFGIPTRIEPSSYLYEWWLYIRDRELIMFGIKGETVNQVYTNSMLLDVSPYEINQTLEDIYRMTIVENEISVETEESTYIFMMNEVDMKTRILVAFEGVYAQLYIDVITNKLAGVRFLSGDVLMQHQPYEFQYIGHIIQPHVPSSYLQSEIDMANATQVYNLVNEFRMQHNVDKLLRMPVLDSIARDYSTDLVMNSVQSNQEEIISLDDRLIENELDTKRYETNVAMGYNDAIEVFHGLINSKTHRTNLLSTKYNVTGTGVYTNTFTQVFYEKDMPDVSK